MTRETAIHAPCKLHFHESIADSGHRTNIQFRPRPYALLPRNAL